VFSPVFSWFFYFRGDYSHLCDKTTVVRFIRWSVVLFQGRPGSGEPSSGTRYKHIHVRSCSAVPGLSRSWKKVRHSLCSIVQPTKNDFFSTIEAGEAGTACQNRRAHGCAKRAYMDVFTACSGRLYLSRRTGGTRKKTPLLTTKRYDTRIYRHSEILYRRGCPAQFRWYDCLLETRTYRPSITRRSP